MATSRIDISPTANGSLWELEEIIKMALKKTGSIKEFDLCAYLSTGDRHFSPSEYLRLRDTDQQTLLNLIREKILNKDPHKPHEKVQDSPAISPYSGKSLEVCIKEAMTKMNVLRETALCKYIPCDVGYMHHFTFLKMKSANPIQLRNLIKEHILDRIPILIPPKKRNRRQVGSFSQSLSSSRSSPVHPFQKDESKGVADGYQRMTEPPKSHQEMFDRREQFLERKQDFLKSENFKIDRLLDMMEQLVQMLQQQEYAKISRRPRAVYEGSAYGETISDRCLLLIQNQLIKKIKMEEADEELWALFKEII